MEISKEVEAEMLRAIMNTWGGDYDEYRLPFMTAHAVRGVCLRHGIDTANGGGPCAAVLMKHYLANGSSRASAESQTEDVLCILLMCIGGGDVDPVDHAATVAKRRIRENPDEYLLSGPWPTPNYGRLASIAFAMCEVLSADGQRTFFIPTRRLATALGVDVMKASRILNSLAAKALIVLVKPHVPNQRAALYRLGSVT